MRARWTSPQGRSLSERLIKALRAKDQSWPELLVGFPRPGSQPELEDLRGLSLEEVDLPEVDLSFVDLSYSRLLNCNLRSVVLQGSKAVRTSFHGSSLGGADLLQADAQHAKFDDVDLSSAMMLLGNFASASFRNAVLRSTVLDRCDLTGADMRGSDLRHASWRKAIVERLFLDGRTNGQPSSLAVGLPRHAPVPSGGYRHYEIVLLVHPDHSEQVPVILDRYKGLITAGGGFVHRVEDWGRRQMAYLIQKLAKAHYLCLNIECSKETLAELETGFRFNDAILRHLTVLKPKAETAPSAMMKAVQGDDARVLDPARREHLTG